MSDIDFSSDLSCSAIFNTGAIMKFREDTKDQIFKEPINTTSLQKFEKPKHLAKEENTLKRPSLSKSFCEIFDNGKNEQEEPSSPIHKPESPDKNILFNELDALLNDIQLDTSSKKVQQYSQNKKIPKMPKRKICPEPCSRSPNPEIQITPAQITDSDSPPQLTSPFQLSTNLMAEACPNSKLASLVIEERKTANFGFNLMGEKETPGFAYSPSTIASNERKDEKPSNEPVNIAAEIKKMFSLDLSDKQSGKYKNLDTEDGKQEDYFTLNSGKVWLYRNKELFTYVSCWCFIRKSRNNPVVLLASLKNKNNFKEYKKMIVEGIWKKHIIQMPAGVKYNLLDLCICYDFFTFKTSESVVSFYKRVACASEEKINEVKRLGLNSFEVIIHLVFDGVEKILAKN